jgi:NAD(P)-dependent dehydrogenase (short-subunit alcohol dehydrogenase family)
MGKLDGIVAIITGGGRGIGRAIAMAYLHEGAYIVVTAAREWTEVESLARAAGPERALALLADASDPAACERVVAETIARFQRVDVLVNNAGRGMKYVSPDFMTTPPRFWEVAPEIWTMIIATNVNGPFFMTRAVIPPMLAQGTGSIINISINYETMKRRGFAPYGPSKAALESASAIWAQDLEGTGIRVNILLPGGATNTGMIPPQMPQETRARLLDPEIITAPAVYLASAASQHVTGRRLIATQWSPEQPDGWPISEGIGNVGY